MINEIKKFLKRHYILVDMKNFMYERCCRVKWLLVRSHLIRSYLENHEIRKLQIGTGPGLMEDWLNTDLHPTSRKVVFLDVTKRFPFKNDTFSHIFSEHMIEHLTYDEGLSMLNECYRILRPGGRIRIATPSLETLLGLYEKEKSDIQQRYIKWTIDTFLPEINSYNEVFVINNAFHNWGHQFIYDRSSFQNIIEEAGFIDVKFYEYGESDDINFQGVETHGIDIGHEDIAKFETMVLEAKRPT